MRNELKTITLTLMIMIFMLVINLSINVASVKASQRMKGFLYNKGIIETGGYKRTDPAQSVKNLIYRAKSGIQEIKEESTDY